MPMRKCPLYRFKYSDVIDLQSYEVVKVVILTIIQQ